MAQRPGVTYAIILVLVANLAPLAGWWWNRSGTPLATLDLSEREAGVRWGGDEDTSVWLQLWRADEWDRRPQASWADSASLASLGFEPDRLATHEVVELAAWRPVRRPAWVLLRLEEEDGSRVGSRLVPVAVGSDPGALYRQAGDRTMHFVLRGVVRVDRDPAPVDSLTGALTGETWWAALDMVSPMRLHVPRSLIAALEDLAAGPAPGADPRYLARLNMGRFHLPWVTAVFPATP